MPHSISRRRSLQIGITGATAAILNGRSILHAHSGTEPNHPTEPCAPAEGHSARLKISLNDDVDGHGISGCIRIRKVGEKVWLNLSPLLLRTEGLSKAVRALGWHVVPGASEVPVPPGRLELEAFAGITTNLVRSVVSVGDGAMSTVGISLRQLFNPSEGGHVAGNTHVHLRSMTREQVNRYLTEIPQADGLEVVFVSYLERALADRTYISNKYTPDDFRKLNGKNLSFGSGQEYRHNFGPGAEGYGHVMLLEMAKRILPASLGPGITLAGTDGTPLRPGIRLAKDGGATIIWCHNSFGSEDIPNWLGGHVDAQNIFDGGNHGSYEDTFYRYLNLGMRVPFSTGTDWFIYDFSRVYVPMKPGQPRTPAAWLAGLRRGQSIITNGPWLEFSVNQAGPGDELNYERPEILNIKARVISRNDFKQLEIIRNGQVFAGIDSRKKDGYYECEYSSSDHRHHASEWWAARVSGDDTLKNELGGKTFAHTSPVYVNFKNRPLFDRDTARGVIEEMEKSTKHIRRFGKFADKGEEERVLSIYREAIKTLQGRLDRIKG